MPRPFFVFMIITVAAFGLAGQAATTRTGPPLAYAATVVNDPLSSQQWALVKVNASAAWDIGTGSNVIVAIIDSGIDVTHPDLQSQVVLPFNAIDGFSIFRRREAPDESGPLALHSLFTTRFTDCHASMVMDELVEPQAPLKPAESGHPLRCRSGQASTRLGANGAGSH